MITESLFYSQTRSSVSPTTMRLIEPGHLEGFCPIKSTSKKNERISRFLFFFCKRTNKIQDLAMQPLKIFKRLK